MYLLNKGADPTIQNTKGETVMSLLSKYSLDLLEGVEGKPPVWYFIFPLCS